MYDCGSKQRMFAGSTSATGVGWVGVSLVCCVLLLLNPVGWLISKQVAKQIPQPHGADLIYAFGMTVSGLSVVSLFEVPIGSNPSPTALIAAVAIGCGLYIVDHLLWQWWTQSPIRAQPVTTTEYVVALCVIPGEECWYRAVPMVLIGFLGATGYGIFSAIIFGVAHAHNGPHEVIIKTWNGLLYAAAFVLTGSLFVPVALHCGYNLTSLNSDRIAGH